jgi:hypothetical protein
MGTGKQRQTTSHKALALTGAQVVNASFSTAADEIPAANWSY